MSELINGRTCGKYLRWQLSGTASLLALVGVVGMNDAQASESDVEHPTVWIEVGGQLGHIIGQGDEFEPAFVTANAGAGTFKPVSPLQVQKNPYFFNHELEGKLILQPEGSDWVFAAALRYGRSNRDRHIHEQSVVVMPTYGIGAQNFEANYADTVVRKNDSNTIVDFSAGKDVGLGVFGIHGTSTLNVGVRFAQFSSNMSTVIRARPEVKIGGFAARTFHQYYLDGVTNRGFSGVGPSLSWNASTLLAGSADTAEAALDFGVNGAVLFGRQKAKINHHTTAIYHHKYHGDIGYYVQTYSKNGQRMGDHSTVTPNIGGFVAISVRRSVAAVSFGYRADLFFGAVDNGIDVRKSSTLGFSGPYATISVGLGG